MKRNFFIYTVVFVILAICTACFLYFTKKEHDLKYIPLRKYAIIKNVDTFKKDSLEKKGTRYLHNLINYKYNLSLQYDRNDSLYFDEIDSILKLKPNESRTAVVDYLKARLMSKQNKVEASKFSLKSLDVFEEHKDTAGLIQNYSLLYFLTQPKYAGEAIADGRINEAYLKKIKELVAQSNHNLDKLTYCLHKMDKLNETFSTKNDTEVKAVFSKAIRIIDSDPSMEFYRAQFYLRFAERFDSLEHYHEMLTFPIIPRKDMIYYNISVDLYAKKKYRESFYYLQLADSVYSASKTKDILAEYIHAYVRVKLYNKLGKSKESIIQALLVRDSLNEIVQKNDKDEMAFELQGKYQMDKKELEIEIKKEENFRLLVFSFLLCVTIVIISVLFWKNNTIKNRLSSEMQMKEDIQRVISHDMLSPLNSLEVMVQRDIENLSTPGSDLHKNFMIQQKYIQNTKLLCQNLINWLWTDTITQEDVNKPMIEDSMERILSALEPFLKVHNCNTTLLVESEAGKEYRLDLNAFNVVFRNLLTNTVRHSKATQIQIILSDQNQRLYLSLYDNGIPLEEDLKKEIEMYVNNKAENNFGRLGSYLIKVFLAKINGKFCFESPSKDNFSNLQTVIIKLK